MSGITVDRNILGSMVTEHLRFVAVIPEVQYELVQSPHLPRDHEPYVYRTDEVVRVTLRLYCEVTIPRGAGKSGHPHATHEALARMRHGLYGEYARDLMRQNAQLKWQIRSRDFTAAEKTVNQLDQLVTKMMELPEQCYQ